MVAVLKTVLEDKCVRKVIHDGRQVWLPLTLP